MTLSKQGLGGEGETRGSIDILFLGELKPQKVKGSRKSSTIVENALTHTNKITKNA